MMPKLTVVIAVLGLTLVSSARATGGASIGSAPTVVYGQQEFGNTVTDEGGEPPNCDTTRGPGRSWWMLPAVVGDRITIDLEGQTEGDGFQINVYPLGTNQFNFPKAQRAASIERQESREELVFTAPSTGSMPMDVLTCDAIGSYDFTTYVTHTVRLALLHLSRLRPGDLLTVLVHSPDGGIVSASATASTSTTSRAPSAAAPAAVAWSTLATKAMAAHTNTSCARATNVANAHRATSPSTWLRPPSKITTRPFRSVRPNARKSAR